jgi:hypothetical protein
MARRTIPVVEVTDPDGKKSLWVAYAIPHDRAVAAVQDRLPPGHTAELAGRRAPHSRKLEGALHGDIIKLEYDADSALPVQSVFTSARSDRYLRQVPQVAVGDFKETVAQLLAMARNMPPGQKRQDALIEIGRLRNRMYVLLRSANNRTGQKRQDALIEIGKLRNRMYVLLRSADNRNFRIKRADSGGP